MFRSSCFARRWAPRLGALAAVLLTCAACASDQAAPLPTAPDTKPRLEALRSDIGRFRLAPLRPVVVDARDGLTPLEVAVLAVLNSPDLQAKRAALGVNAAEVFSAGLLPDPQITGGADRPVAGPDHETAYSVSPAFDLAGLLQRSAARRMTRFKAKQADLDLLWAEWGVAQQARILAETTLADEAKVAALQAVVDPARDRARESAAALARGDVAAQTAAADLAAKLDVETQLASARHDADKARRDLNALLNLDASVRLPLVAGPQASTYRADALARRLKTLPQRRPDLLALQAGYAAQDQAVRRAILAQFPLTQIALALARDTAGVTTIGGAGTFALPIFNGGRGEVRLQKATREQLRAEYQARLDQAAAQAKTAEAELASASALAARLRADVPRLQALAAPAQAALARRDIDSQTYLALLQNVMTKRTQLADQILAARTAEIQLETALFLPPAGSRMTP